MSRQIDEGRINQLIAQLCAARADDEAAVTEAHALAQASPLPYSDDAMKAFCLAGEKMRATHERKMAAWDRIRDAVLPPGFRLDRYDNAEALKTADKF